MVQHGLARADALGTGQTDVILVQLVYHIAAHPHGVGGNAAQRHGDHRQDPADGPVLIKDHGQRQPGGDLGLDK